MLLEFQGHPPLMLGRSSKMIRVLVYCGHRKKMNVGLPNEPAGKLKLFLFSFIFFNVFLLLFERGHLLFSSIIFEHVQSKGLKLN